MSVSLKNLNVLITGASSGIGEACASAFAREGANLLLAARRKERIDRLAGSLEEADRTLADLEAELAHDFGREDVATVGGLVLAEFGRVPRTGEERAIDGWHFVIDVVVRRRVRRVTITAPVDNADDSA